MTRLNFWLLVILATVVLAGLGWQQSRIRELVAEREELRMELQGHAAMQSEIERLRAVESEERRLREESRKLRERLRDAEAALQIAADANIVQDVHDPSETESASAEFNPKRSLSMRLRRAVSELKDQQMFVEHLELLRAVEEGEMTEEMAEARQSLLSREHDFDKLKTDVEERVDRGEFTDEEAASKLLQARTNLMAERLEVEHLELQQAVHDGEITQEMANARESLLYGEYEFELLETELDSALARGEMTREDAMVELKQAEAAVRAQQLEFEQLEIAQAIQSGEMTEEMAEIHESMRRSESMLERLENERDAANRQRP